MKTSDAYRGILGLCMRSGGLVSGQQACEIAIKREQCKLLLLDADASEATKKRLINQCAARSIPAYLLPPGEPGASIGKPERMAAAVTAPGWVERIRQECERAEFVNISGVE